MDIPPLVEHVVVPDQAQHLHYYAPLAQVVSITQVYGMILLTDNISYVQLPAIPADIGFQAHARPVQGVQPQAQLYGPQLGPYVRLNLSISRACLSKPSSISGLTRYFLMHDKQRISDD
jgi:hypothetical protein